MSYINLITMYLIANNILGYCLNCINLLIQVTDNEGEDNYDDNLVKLEKRTGFYDGNIDNALHVSKNISVLLKPKN